MTYLRKRVELQLLCWKFWNKVVKTNIVLGVKDGQRIKADNLTAICEPIV
jgi:hypothetical protein